MTGRFDGCPNAPDGWSEWICLCGHAAKDIRQFAATLWNGWISADGETRLHALASNGEVSNDEIRAYLISVERNANYAYGLWRDSL